MRVAGNWFQLLYFQEHGVLKVSQLKQDLFETAENVCVPLSLKFPKYILLSLKNESNGPTTIFTGHPWGEM